MAFYNTTGEKGIVLDKAHKDAKKQDERILAFFKKHGRLRLFTPWDVQVHLGEDTLITSIRRSINTLTKQGHLVKTHLKVKGPYGRPSYCWKLKGGIK